MKIVRRAAWDSLVKLHPVTMMRNPVMFVVEVGSVVTTVLLIVERMHREPGFGFNVQITLWLWFTVLFANFAEAMAEGRGKAQADALRRAKAETMANRLLPDGKTETVPGSKFAVGRYGAGGGGRVCSRRWRDCGRRGVGGRVGDHGRVGAGDSRSGRRPFGSDGWNSGAFGLVKVKITSNPGETFLDRMIALVEGAERQKTPNEIALNILLAGLTIVFLLAVVTLQPFAIYAGAPQTVFVLVSLLVCLIRPQLEGCSRRLALRAWTGWCSTMCWRCQGERWKLRAM